MPSLNLRLSREQHEALVVAARESARSLQREIVWRLFRGRDGLRLVEGRGVSGPTHVSAAEGLCDVVPSAAPRSRQQVSFEHSVKECPRRNAHNSLRVCPLCGADSA